MNTPPLLLGTALLFWGWQTGLFLIAIPAAALLEVSRWIQWRLELEQDHYNRLWNLSALLVIGLGLYQFFTQGGYSALTEMVERGQAGARTESLRSFSNLVLRTVQLLPAALLLFMVAFAYGPLRTLPATTFSLLYRRLAQKSAAPGAPAFQMPTINPSYAYFILVLLAASASQENPTWYFPAITVLIGWALWFRRARSFSPWAWAGGMALAVVLGYSSQIGLVALQKVLEQWQNKLMSEFGNASFDTAQTRTSMGRSGKLKLSGRIVWRVQPGQSNPPALLREAAFNRYEQPTAPRRDGRWDEPAWTTRLRKFEPILDSAWNRPAETRGPERNYSWVLNSNATPSRAVTLTGYTRNGEANLPLPSGSILVTDLTAWVVALHTNGMGAARINGAQSLAVLETRYGPTGGFESPPNPDDQDLEGLAPADLQAVQRIARELKLATAKPEAALALIRLFLFNNFEYSTELSPPIAGSTNNTPLAAFLLDRRQGHCEYFATATTLLLRAAGIPSRYAVGYSVQEKRSGNEYVIRNRHAHAWALAWINQRWVEVDCTPAGWFESEWAQVGPWESWGDWISDAWLGFHRWRQGDSNVRLYVFLGGMIALGFLAWRQLAGKQWRRAQDRQQRAREMERRGMDSEFFLVEQALEKKRPRTATEPVRVWLARQSFSPHESGQSLLELLNLHYRHRFDPAGLAPEDRARLRDGSLRWLADHRLQNLP